MTRTRKPHQLTVVLASILSVVVVAALGVTTAVAGPAASTAGGHGRRLTNLAHLDWLGDAVTPPVQTGHTTYQLDAQPSLGVLWTYADRSADGSFRRVGGGSFDAATNTYGQGAFNADDISRAAVVYLRDWAQTRDDASRAHAQQLLRGLTYLQTATGPNAGNVVLWMQPDGRLQPSANPKELPDPSDSGPSFWLARTIWALGEGYAAFRESDPAFARFLAERLDLAIAALDRQVLTKYGQYLDIDGRRTPAWLVVDGADASAEAVLGLTAYVEAGGSPQARRSLAQLAEGVAALQGGTARAWPFGGVESWALSRSVWHAWASQMPAALADASRALHDPKLAQAAATDSGTFDPWLLTSGGPDNGRMPTPSDTTQIAYGIDSRVQSLVATARATGSDGPKRLAGISAAWFFGANRAGTPAYDPATGVTIDGISGTGVVNHNSGAESTIHGLLTMLALDADPAIARLARVATIASRTGAVTVQAEGMPVSGNAATVTPASTWTGEALYGGSGFVRLGDGASVTVTVPDGGRSLVLPVVNLEPGNATTLRAAAGRMSLGELRIGDIGPQGDSPTPGALLPVTLPRELDAGTSRQVTLTAAARSGQSASVDAVMVQPLVSSYVLRSDRDGVALVSSASTSPERTTVTVPGHGRPRIEMYDGQGRLVSTVADSAAADSAAAASAVADSKAAVAVEVLPGGYTIVTR